MKLLPRILLVAVIGSGVAAGAYFAIQARFNSMNPNEMGNSSSGKPDSRPTPKPSGTFAVHIERSKLPQAPVAGLSDKGDILLQTTPPQEYDYYSGGQTKHLKSMSSNVRYQLSPTGQLMQLASEKITSGNSPLVYPFNEASDRPMFFSDGSLAVTRKNVSLNKNFKKPAGDFYALSRETQFPTDKGKPPGMADASGIESKNPQMAGIPQQHFNQPSKSTELFTSSKALSVLAVDDKDNIWVSEREGNRSKSTEKLLKFTGAAHEEIASPAGYTNILRAAATGDQVVVTFGTLGGKLPFRSFILNGGKDWKELPLPNGSDCSFAQQVLSNGAILGYVTDLEGKNLKHVIWKGDALAVLDEQEGWPKQGEISLVTRYNRAGDIGVRNITDASSGTSEYYLLSIKL